MRLVLDTAVMVAALRSNRGAANRLLAAGLQRRYVLLTSVPLMLEYEAVLTRPEHLDTAGLTREDIGVLLDAVASAGELVRLHFSWRPQVADPDDDMVLETAANGVPTRLPLSTCATSPNRHGASVSSPSNPAPACVDVRHERE